MKGFEDALVHKTVSELFDMVKSKQAEVDELKRKLNEIVILVRDNTPDYYLDNMIDEILKGENHES